MASRKPAAPRPAAAKQKSVSAAEKGRRAASTRVWTLPLAMLMLVVGAAGLWFAVRESANAPQAATPAATASMAPIDDAVKPASASAAPRTHAAGESAAPKAAVAPAPDGVKPVSVTGCLARAGRGFVLKNAEGADLPRARSWKSGFLKRSTVSIDLSDPANAVRLGSHDGQRVSVTGPLVGREMQVRSLRAMSASCQ